MKILLFIILLIVIIAISLQVYHTDFLSSSQCFSGFHNVFRKGLITVAIILLFFIIRIMLKNEALYTYIFIGLIALPIIYEYLNYNTYHTNLAIEKEIVVWDNKAKEKYVEIWGNIDKTQKALAMFDDIELAKIDTTYSKNQIEMHRTAFYFTLGLNNESYYNEFLDRTKHTDSFVAEYAVRYMLKYYIPKTDEEYTRVLTVFIKGLMIPSQANRFFTFGYLVAQGFENAALLVLKKTEINNKNAYSVIANKIEDKKMRVAALKYINQ